MRYTCLYCKKINIISRTEITNRRPDTIIEMITVDKIKFHPKNKTKITVICSNSECKGLNNIFV